MNFFSMLFLWPWYTQIFSLWTSAVQSAFTPSHSCAWSLLTLVPLSSSSLFSVISRIDGLGPRRHCSLLGLALVSSLGPDSETMIAPAGAVNRMEMMHTITIVLEYSTSWCWLVATSSTAGPRAAWKRYRERFSRKIWDGELLWMRSNSLTEDDIIRQDKRREYKI